MLKDIKVKCKEPIIIYCDNLVAIDISKNLVLHSKTKHVSIKMNFLREKVEAKEIKLVYVNTKEHIADIFTTPLPKETFEYLREQ
ncbi:Ty1/Copia family ribonuclease HI, partial [Klebsiella pneumoniae]